MYANVNFQRYHLQQESSKEEVELFDQLSYKKNKKKQKTKKTHAWLHTFKK